MKPPRLPLPAFLLGMALGLSGPAAQGLPPGGPPSAASPAFCEFKPLSRCLDLSAPAPAPVEAPGLFIGIRRDGLDLCSRLSALPSDVDLVLLMDNSGSMDSLVARDGKARYCLSPRPEDPECLSGDPQRLRGPALRTFLDSALLKSRGDTRVGIVTFSTSVMRRSTALVPLTAATLPALQSEIVMETGGFTNYTRAFEAALELLRRSDKPRSRQALVLVSNGRPTAPSGGAGPYGYKQVWDEWPQVHAVFLGDNPDEYRDMREISMKTGGTFRATRDVRSVAAYLTATVLPEIFQRPVPNRTVLRNSRTGRSYAVGSEGHLFSRDSSAFSLLLPGPVFLEEGVNLITVETSLGSDSAVRTASFSVRRGGEGPFAEPAGAVCHDTSRLTLLNAKGVPLLETGPPYRLEDPELRFRLRASAAPDSFSVPIVTVPGDEEVPSVLRRLHAAEGLFERALPFEPSAGRPRPRDGKVQSRDGDRVRVVYRNPYLPPDSASAAADIVYGPGLEKAFFRDAEGDGRIERVGLDFKESLGGLPGKLLFRVRDAAGRWQEREARRASGEIRFLSDAKGSPDPRKVEVELRNPFPAGLTGFSKPDSLGRSFQEPGGPLFDAFFPVQDSVAPVLLNGEVQRRRAAGGTFLQVTLSEPVLLPEAGSASSPSAALLGFKRGDRLLADTAVRIRRAVKISENRYELEIDPASPYQPVGGDSIALREAGGIRDLQGNVQKHPRFLELGGYRPRQALDDFYATFPNGEIDNPASGLKPALSEPVDFVSIGADGKPLPGTGPGKCPACRVGENGRFTGPVFHLRTRRPVTWKFRIFSNLGMRVAEAEGTVTPEDLNFLDFAEDATTPGAGPGRKVYLQRVVWNGRAGNGQMAATGAYILLAEFHFDADPESGAPAGTDRRTLRFGLLR